jgi:L-asparagine oxygenase
MSTSMTTMLADAACVAEQTPGGETLPQVRPNGRQRLILFKELVAMDTPNHDFEDYLTSLQRPMVKLPRGVVRAVREFACNPSHPGALLVRNFPIDPFLPRTPADGGRALDKQTWVTEGCLLMLARLVDEPFAYTNEKNGELIHTVAPVQGSAKKASNEGSEIDFLPHTEVAALPFRPDHLLLYCLRDDHTGEAGTSVADVRVASRHLSEEDLAELRQPQFRIRIPQSFVQSGEAWSEPRPVIFGPTAFPEVCVNFNGVVATTERAKKALTAFAETLQRPDVEHWVFLKPGDCLLIDNRKAVHGRGKFTPRYDGYDRWLQRVYTRTELWSGRRPNQVARRLF